MPFLMTYWKQIAIVATFLLSFGFGYYKGYVSQKAEFDLFKMQVKVNADLQREKNEQLLKKQKQISENITKEYADAVKKLNSYYAKHPRIKWMQHTNASTSRMSENTSTTTATDGKTESNLPDTTGNIAIDCASDVLQLLYLQDWIKSQKLAE